MEQEEVSGELSSFWDSGIYRMQGSTAVFVDPVRVLNHSYTRFRVSPSSYYSRSFESTYRGGRGGGGSEQIGVSSSDSKKRKRKKRRSHDLNERERAAEHRHQEARPFLLKAHEAFLGAAELLSVLPDVIRDEELPQVGRDDAGHNFIELGSHWQAPLYEMSLCFQPQSKLSEGKGARPSQCGERTIVPLFNNSVFNETDDDVESEFLNSWYILPRKSCFHMSDLRQIHGLIPAQSDHGYNLIVIDPPWENGSAYQKSLYPTLPNRYFLYLPVKQLAHTEGALVALWMTNREKLWMFVEEELFPAWGVTNVTACYWLKVKADGSLIGDLDLFHHRPYECLLLGYINRKRVDSLCATTFGYPQNNQVVISIPGAHSRKPPLGKLLLEYLPGPKPAKYIELFARELRAGWTSWGNEPLCFQDSSHFVDKSISHVVPYRF